MKRGRWTRRRIAAIRMNWTKKKKLKNKLQYAEGWEITWLGSKLLGISIWLLWEYELCVYFG